MSYQVLARKWRPATFEQMVGQSHVLQALTNALSQQRLHHAYLFTGTRGVGKTSLARLFAKGLNCEQGVTASPCGTCSSCVEISQGRFVDLIEVDAASRTKVDDTRELLDNVQYRPARGRYKVYLIDEVHMLSRSSFNALLKTLEEPPEHVKFLLATTDPHKLPVTVLSRCLQFNLKSLSLQEIQQQVAFILGQEQVNFEPQALSLLAKAANGSMRDALSLTDQAIAFGSGQVTLTQVQTMLGSIDERHVIGLLSSLCDAQVGPLMQAIGQVLAFGADADEVLRSLLELLHQITLSQFAPAAAQQSLYSEQILAFAHKLSPEQVQLYYQILLTGRKELAFAPDPKSGLEMALLRAVAFVPEKPVKRWLVDEGGQDDAQQGTQENLPKATFLDVAQQLAAPQADAPQAVVSAAILASNAIAPALILPVKKPLIQAANDIEDEAQDAVDGALIAEQALLISQATSMGLVSQADSQVQAELSVPHAPLVPQQALAVQPEVVQNTQITEPASSLNSDLGSHLNGGANASVNNGLESDLNSPLDTSNVTDEYADYQYIADAASDSDKDNHNTDYSAFDGADFTETNIQNDTFANGVNHPDDSSKAIEATAEADLFADNSLLDAVLASNDSLLASVKAEASTDAAPKEGEAKKPLAVPRPGNRATELNNEGQQPEQASALIQAGAPIQTSTPISKTVPSVALERPPWVAAPDGSSPFSATNISTIIGTNASANTSANAALLNNAALLESTSDTGLETELNSHQAVAEAQASAYSVQASAISPSYTENALQTKLDEVVNSDFQDNVEQFSMPMPGPHQVSGHELDLHWYKMMASVKIGGRIRQLAVNSIFLSLENPMRLMLKPDQKHLSADIAISQLTTALSELLDHEVVINVEVGQDAHRETPLELRKRFHQELLAQAKQSLVSDTKVQWLFNELGAQLQEDSLVYPPEQLLQISQQIQSIGYSQVS
jgi:DNA polymerase-3 subunit gamma/tau